MPRMDGLTFLQKIMSQHPIPVVICSSLAEEGAQSTLQGARVRRGRSLPNLAWAASSFWRIRGSPLCQAVKAAAAARLRTVRPSHAVEPKLTADAILSPATHAMAETTEKVVAIGASTGRNGGAQDLLETLPPDAPAS
jgi:two-component system, chemotaxis family, protein-glutamate methylesterase/glutaminase